MAAALAHDEEARRRHGAGAVVNFPRGFCPEAGKEEAAEVGGSAQDEGAETDGDESFDALFALFQGPHVEQASPRPTPVSTPTSTAAASALGFAQCRKH